MGIKTIMGDTHSDAISIPAIILKKWDISLLGGIFYFCPKNGDLS